METLKFDELRTAAENVKRSPEYFNAQRLEYLRVFRAKATPDAVLALLDRIAKLEKKR